MTFTRSFLLSLVVASFAQAAEKVPNFLIVKCANPQGAKAVFTIPTGVAEQGTALVAFPNEAERPGSFYTFQGINAGAAPKGTKSPFTNDTLAVSRFMMTAIRHLDSPYASTTGVAGFVQLKFVADDSLQADGPAAGKLKDEFNAHLNVKKIEHLNLAPSGLSIVMDPKLPAKVLETESQADLHCTKTVF